MERMSPLDASFLYMENDVTPLHIGGVSIFEGPPPGHDELISQLAAKLHQVPRYRQKVRMMPWNVGLPVWVDDPHFNIDYHVRRSAVASPGGEGELYNLVSRVMAQHLDRARPLWEMWAVEGLDNGRWAMVSKVHHCMVDGASGADLMSVLFDAERVPPPAEIIGWQPGPQPSTADVIRSSVGGAFSSIGRAGRALATLGSPRGIAEQGVDTIRALVNVAPKLTPTPSSPLNGDYGPHRRWTIARGSIADVKTARAALGGTVNDVVLAVIAAGFRDLLIGRGERARPVRTMVPVSVRAESERGRLANRVSAVFVDLPADVADPVSRLAAVRHQMDGLKQSRGAVAGERLTELAGFAPPMLLAAGQRLAASASQRSVNTVTTNVPGPQHPLYFAGRRLVESAPFVPLAASIRIAVAIFSYDGKLAFGVTGDYDTAPDIDVLRRGIETGLADLVAAANSASPTGSGKAASKPPRRKVTSGEG
jgi:WS/DGAT/MGAT family acyltransferase